MKLVVCIDKNQGMMFGGRRVSQDSEVTDRIVALADGSCLFVTPYSQKMIPEGTLLSGDDFSVMGSEDVYFLEDGPMPTENIDEVCVFCWNRRYPADRLFSMDLKGEGYKRVKKEEFVGSSHDKITFECYRKG